jgi:hypothetical protein
MLILIKTYKTILQIKNKEKKMTKKFLLLVIALVLVCSGKIFSQTDIGPDTRLNVPSSMNITPMEKGDLSKQVNIDNKIPTGLMQQYINAKKNRNDEEKTRLGKEIDKYLNVIPSKTDETMQPVTAVDPPFNQDWGIGDILVHSGNVAYTSGFRQMDLKQGEDGYLYLCVNRRNVSGFNGYWLVYKSPNAGRNWYLVSGATNASSYFGQVSMLVEKKSSTVDDSTKILVYFTSSTSASMDNATLALCSFKRDGTGWFAVTAGTPASGNKYQYPSACSDGMYYSTATYMHCIVQEVTNANAHVRLAHFRTTDWGNAHTSSNITTTYDDFYPSSAYCEKSGNDSIYIAVERRFSSTYIGLRLITTPDAPSAATFTYYLAAGTNVKYEKPCITVQQEAYSTPRKILVTSTKDSIIRTARYHGSVTGGNSWDINYALGSSTMITDFTWCNSDSLSAGGGYFIAAFVDVNGDSITVRRGIIGSMGTYLYKRNGNQSTGTLPPVVCIYKTGTTKYSAFAYAGSGPNNVFFNQENLPAVGINPIGSNIPKDFSLYQNYPNPFNPVTQIKFDIPKSGFVSIKVYNLLGVEVATLLSEEKTAGSYMIPYNASALSSGIYFYKIQSGNFSEVKKMTLIK